MPRTNISRRKPRATSKKFRRVTSVKSHSARVLIGCKPNKQKAVGGAKKSTRHFFRDTKSLGRTNFLRGGGGTQVAGTFRLTGDTRKIFVLNISSRPSTS